MIVEARGEEELELSIAVSLKTQLATNVPDVQRFPPNSWASMLTQRQARSVAVFLAYEQGEAVGTALLEKVPRSHDYWPLCPSEQVREALSKSELLEFGGIAVLPQSQGRGLGKALQQHCLDWAWAHSYPFVVSSAWADSDRASKLGSKGRLIETDGNRIHRYLWVKSGLIGPN